MGPTPTPATIYVACSSDGQSARLWPWRSSVRGRSPTPHGSLAQLVERQTEDLRVPGPIPGGPTTYGRMPESGQLGRTVNPLPRGCVGSNPTSPTIKYSAQLFYHDNGRRICYPIITKALAATADELSGQGRKRALCRAMLAGKKQYGVGHMKMFCMLESRHQKSTNSN